MKLMEDGIMSSPQIVGDLCIQSIPADCCTSNKQTDSKDLFESSADLKCSNNFEDHPFDMDALLDPVQKGKAGDIEVDVINCTDYNVELENEDDPDGDYNVELENEDDPDGTEYSSSFGGTMSESDEVHGSKCSDAEINSQLRGESEASMSFNGTSRLLPARKKRLTAHWRRYIHPLSWRCKWVELRLHDLQSQAKRYERALLASANRKHPKNEEIDIENCASRFLPLSSQNQYKHIMKRQKRNRMEDTVDIISYMLHHNLFAYYEKKMLEIDGSVDDNGANQAIAVEPTRFCADDLGANFEGPSYEFGDEDSLEQMLWTIEVLQSRVGNLKTELDKVVSKHSGKISSGETLGQTVQDELLTSSIRSATISPEFRHEMPVASASTPPHHVPINEHEETGIPASTVSCSGDATPHPDVIENTVGLLSGCDGSLDQSQALDDVLIHNQATEETLQNLGKISKPVERRGKELLQGKNAFTSEILPIRKRVKRLPGGSGLDKPVLRVSYRRKRGERAVAQGRWKASRASKRRRIIKKKFYV